MKRLLSKNNGVETWVDIDGDKTHVTKKQDISGTLDLNKALANHNGKAIMSDAYNHVATIPPIIIAKWLYEDGIDIYNPEHSDKVKRKLNDPEYRYLRTSELTI